jgi:hypothetical protein
MTGEYLLVMCMPVRWQDIRMAQVPRCGGDCLYHKINTECTREKSRYWCRVSRALSSLILRVQVTRCAHDSVLEVLIICLILLQSASAALFSLNLLFPA